MSDSVLTTYSSESVCDNLANFHSDPCNIALWGHAAGAVLIDNHALSFAEDTIACTLILESSIIFIEFLTSSSKQISYR